MPLRPITLMDVLLGLVQDSSTQIDTDSNEITNSLVPGSESVGAADASVVNMYGSGLGLARPQFDTMEFDPIALNDPTVAPFAVFGYSLFGVTAFAGKVVPVALDYRSVVMGDNPVAYWRFSERVGLQTWDWASPGFSHTGTLNGGVTPGSAGALGSDSDPSFAFDGSTGYVTASIPAEGNNFTYEGWYKTSSTGNNNICSSSQNYRLLGVFSGKLEAAVSNGTIVADPASSNDGHWHHGVVTYDGTTLKLYRDGTLVASTASVNDGTGATSFAIGAMGVNTTLYRFNGSIDEVAVYNVTLTATQVSNHYAMGTLSTFKPPEKMGAKGTYIVNSFPVGLKIGDATYGRISLNAFG